MIIQFFEESTFQYTLSMTNIESRFLLEGLLELEVVVAGLTDVEALVVAKIDVFFTDVVVGVKGFDVVFVVVVVVVVVAGVVVVTAVVISGSVTSVEIPVTVVVVTNNVKLTD